MFVGVHVVLYGEAGDSEYPVASIGYTVILSTWGTVYVVEDASWFSISNPVLFKDCAIIDKGLLPELTIKLLYD